MLILQLLLALGLIFIPLWPWLERLLPPRTTCRSLLISGYALVLGMIGITLIMRLLSALDIPFSLGSITVVATLVFLAGLLAPDKWRNRTFRTAPSQAIGVHLTGWHRFLVGVLLALLFSRLVALGLEAGTRPLFAWDAKQHWTKQAKVFFELERIAPYVTLEKWLKLGGEGVFTNMHPDYAVTAPLLQTWMNVALGQWHDSLMNLPWVLIWVALGLVFYSQARVAGIGSVTSLAATYMVLSLPYLNVQVALAGYSDLLVALCFLAALAAFYNWSQSRNYWQGLLFVLSALCCLLIKNEGFFWFLSFAAGLVLAILGSKRGLWAGGLILLAISLVVWVVPENWVVAGHSLQELSLHYRPQGWQAIYESFMVHDNWHFLSYLVICAWLLFAFRFRRLAPTLSPVAAVIASSIVFYLCLYLFTRYSFGAVRFTSLNRVALQLIPAMAFFTLLVYANMSRDIAEQDLSSAPG